MIDLDAAVKAEMLTKKVAAMALYYWGKHQLSRDTILGAITLKAAYDNWPEIFTIGKEEYPEGGSALEVMNTLQSVLRPDLPPKFDAFKFTPR